MTDDQLRALASLNAPPMGIDRFTWWIAPFLIVDASDQAQRSRDKQEIQLDFFDINASGTDKNN